MRYGESLPELRSPGRLVYQFQVADRRQGRRCRNYRSAGIGFGRDRLGLAEQRTSPHNQEKQRKPARHSEILAIWSRSAGDEILIMKTPDESRSRISARL